MTDEPWTRGRIRYELEKAGWTNMRTIDATYGLPIGTISNVVRQPHPKGEQVLSEILGVPPQEIWPGRYDASGRRLKPQPENEPRTEANARHRQKERAA